MRPLLSSFVILALLVVAIFLGAMLRRRLPERHLNKESQDAIRVSVALIATIAALVLSLLISAAKNSYDTQNSQIKRITADVIQLDGLLAYYGQEALPIRQHLRNVINIVVDRIWQEKVQGLKPFKANVTAEKVDLDIRALSPHTDMQRSLKDSATRTIDDIEQIRLLLYTETGNAIPMPFLVVLVLWLIIIFSSFSLFAQLNPTVFFFLTLFALSAAGAIFLILELSEPFTGLMTISSSPLRHALSPLGA